MDIDEDKDTTVQTLRTRFSSHGQTTRLSCATEHKNNLTTGSLVRKTGSQF